MKVLIRKQAQGSPDTGYTDVYFTMRLKDRVPMTRADAEAMVANGEATVLKMRPGNRTKGWVHPFYVKQRAERAAWKATIEAREAAAKEQRIQARRAAREASE
jgi:hypothetical protein